MQNLTWMYNGQQCGKAPSIEWINGTTKFLNSAFYITDVAKNDTIKCPCAKYQNYFGHKSYNVEIYLYRNGKEGYENWTKHGKGIISHDEYNVETERALMKLII